MGGLRVVVVEVSVRGGGDVFLSYAHADRERVLELRDALVACHSAAAVRGTKWLSEERCDGTLTSVSRGSVSVRSTTTRCTVIVRAGRSYFARAQRAAIRRRG